MNMLVLGVTALVVVVLGVIGFLVLSGNQKATTDATITQNAVLAALAATQSAIPTVTITASVTPTPLPSASATVSDTPTQTLSPTPADTATATDSPTPTHTPTHTPSPTPATPEAVALRGLPVRLGPSTAYPLLVSLKAGDRIDITGISEDGLWYQIS